MARRLNISSLLRIGNGGKAALVRASALITDIKSWRLLSNTQTEITRTADQLVFVALVVIGLFVLAAQETFMMEASWLWCIIGYLALVLVLRAFGGRSNGKGERTVSTHQHLNALLW
jgi:hypothetical protein